MLRKLTQIFASTYTAVVLIALIVIFSAYGTLLAPSPEKAFASVYASPLFMGLFFLLAVNLILCSLKRLPAVLRQLLFPRLSLNPDFFLRQPLNYSIIIETSKKETFLANLRRILPRYKYSNRCHYFIKQKGISNRLAPYLIHSGILIVLVAGLIHFVLVKIGYIVTTGRIVVPEAESVDYYLVASDQQVSNTAGSNYLQRPLGFSLRCLDFDEVKYPGSDIPQYYSSTVSVEDDNTNFVYTIDMNNPLKWRGYKIHQVDFQLNPEVLRYQIEVHKLPDLKLRLDVSPDITYPLTELALSKSSPPVLNVTVEPARKLWQITEHKANNEKVSYSGALLPPPGDYYFSISKWVTDFRRDSNGNVYSQSAEFNNPAVYITLYRGDTAIYSRWYFWRPEFRNFMNQPDDLFNFEFIEFKAQEGNSLDTKFQIRVKSTFTDKELGSYWVSINQRQKLDFPNFDLEENKQIDSALGRSVSNPYRVYLLGKTEGYTTVLGVVRDPTPILIFIGGGIISLGTICLYFVRFYRLIAMYDEQESKLYLTIITAQPTARIKKIWEGLLTRLEFGGGKA
ncbi:MAG: cytochrome c biogenesis protein ResB [Candidatus Sumerlaeia bacterium]|nr:cytochrome c biogenesis protein ResB [Candidatus Sumerlaeia bacterium]